MKEPGDCLLINNYNLKWKEVLIDRINNNWKKATKQSFSSNIHSLEQLKYKHRILFHTELNNYHFPFLKKHRAQDIYKYNWISIEEFKKFYLQNINHKIEPSMISKETLKKIFLTLF
ncbi:TPA: hypothetical protein R4566_000480 [Campylobacter jejuni]|nr:beta-1,4-N-acetylgalactosaminyltransferase [Campylobacter jejuni subsp. jejuni ICDCCJ07001]EKC1361796.1 hypothetical protein [Campylobacter jejuni]HED4707690.1 hypothetical protein [Campylobacter jejuni]